VFTSQALEQLHEPDQPGVVVVLGPIACVDGAHETHRRAASVPTDEIQQHRDVLRRFQGLHGDRVASRRGIPRLEQHWRDPFLHHDIELRLLRRRVASGSGERCEQTRLGGNRPLRAPSIDRCAVSLHVQRRPVGDIDAERT
jgi:hypothetical protein